MKRTSIPICLAAFALTLFGQDGGDHYSWMKTIGATSGSLRKNLAAKNGEAAATDAKKLQSTFGQVRGFWSQKSAEDATKFAAEAQDGFGTVAQEASSGKFEEASASLKKVSAACGGCHSAHREKAADGSWKIK